MASRGGASRGRAGKARPGLARPAEAWHGEAGKASRVIAWLGEASRGRAGKQGVDLRIGPFHLEEMRMHQCPQQRRDSQGVILVRELPEGMEFCPVGASDLNALMAAGTFPDRQPTLLPKQVTQAVLDQIVLTIRELSRRSAVRAGRVPTEETIVLPSTLRFSGQPGRPNRAPPGSRFRRRRKSA